MDAAQSTDPPAGGTPAVEPLDLDLVERDLAAVEAALARLDAGTYWTDEITGAAIPDEALSADPTVRRSDPA